MEEYCVTLNKVSLTMIPVNRKDTNGRSHGIMLAGTLRGGRMGDCPAPRGLRGLIMEGRFMTL